MIGELISHYRVTRQLGAGGMGIVYLARDEQLDRDVAIKVLAPGILADSEAQARFRMEAQLLARLNNPYIEMVFDFGTIRGHDYIVLEYVPGETLRDLVAKGALPELEVLRLGIMLASGLEAAHGKGVLHRDLKPGNLMQTVEGRLKILDFGLAVVQPARASNSPESGSAPKNILSGTLPYIAPEQLNSGADHRTDLYAMGAVLYELATGSPPFPSANASELMDSILHEAPPIPRQLNVAISPLFEAFLLKALQKNPVDRHQSAAEMRGELERIKSNLQSPSGSANFEQSQSPVLELSYVLFTDIVGYSRLATDSQQRLLRQLQRIVRETSEFQLAQKESRLIRLPTGDGMALAFFVDPEAPVRCAIAISRALQSFPEIHLRMGMHAGPVYRVDDINGNQNVAGEGINIAQRVMDCGDAGHILVSKALADVLKQLTGWTGALRDLGEATVKHGVRVHVYSLQKDGVGNADLPSKFRSSPALPKPWILASFVMVAAVLLASTFAIRWYLRGHPEPALAPAARPTVAVLGFTNQAHRSEADWISEALLEQLTSELEAGNHVVTTPGENVARAKIDLTLREDTTYGSETLKRIHQALHCDYLVYGSFYAPGKQGGGTIRLDVRIQDATSGATLESVIENGTEVRVSDIATMAGAKLRGRLGLPGISATESAEVQAAAPSTAEATKLYYQGVDRLRKFDSLGARDVLQGAIKSDPNFALAYSALAEAWSKLGYDERAREAARQAFALSSHLSRDDRLTVEARYRESSSEWDKAMGIYQSLWTFYPENPEYALRAADVLIRAGRGNDALKTIDMLRKAPGPMSQDPRLDLKAAEAAESLGNFAKEKESAERAANAAKVRGSRLLQAEALWRNCAAMASLGDAAAAQTACQTSIEIAKPVGDLLLVARAFTILGQISGASGNPQQGLQQHRQALQFARQIGSRRDVTGALINIGDSLASQGDLVAAEKSYNEALGVAREIHDQGQAITSLNNLATISQVQGRYVVALHLYQQALETARSVHDQAGTGRALSNIGTLYSLQGNFPAALQAIQGAMKTTQDTGLKADQVGFLYALGDLEQAQGNLEDAEANYQSGEALALRIGHKMNIALGQLSLGGLRLLQGRCDDALKLARQAADDFHAEAMTDQESQATNLIASCHLESHQDDGAKKELRAAQQLSPQDPNIKLSVLITAGRIAIRSGGGVEGKNILKDVVLQAKRLNLPGIEFEARLAQGEMGLFDGNKPAGLAVLTSLQKEASRKGFKNFELRANEMAKRIKSISGP